MQFVIQSLLALGIKLLTSSVIEKVVLLGLRELAKNTDNEVDNELVTRLPKPQNLGSDGLT